MGPKSEVDPTGGLRKHMDAIIFNLDRRREELEAEKQKYATLSTSISQSSSKDEIMVLLGDGYFVKHSPKSAQDFLKRRSEHIDGALGEVLARLDEVKATLKKMDDFDTAADSGGEKYNEEGLLFSEIREELDEEGNVLSVKINDVDFGTEVGIDSVETDRSNVISDMTVLKEKTPEISETENEPTNSNPSVSEIISGESTSNPRTLNLLQELDSSETDIDAFENLSTKSTDANGADSTGRQAEILTDIVENSSGFDIDFVKDDITSVVVVPNAANGETETEEANEENETSVLATQAPEVISDLLQEMEVIGNTNLTKEDELLEKLDSLDISADDKFRLKTLLLEEYRNQRNPVDSTNSSDTQNSERDRQDLIELEILADDFDGNEDFNQADFADDEEWDFEFSDDEDDHDDEGDDLLYGKSSFIADNNSNSRLWDEVLKLRKLKEEKEVPIEDNKIDGNSDKISNERKETDLNKEISQRSLKNMEKPQKSVRFAEKLQIFEVENISAELKSIHHTNQNVSIFMQNRLLNKPDLKNTIIEKTADDMRAVEPVVIDRELRMDEGIPKSTKLSRFRMMQNERRERSTSSGKNQKKKGKLEENIVEDKNEEDEIVEHSITGRTYKSQIETVGDIVEKDIDLDDTTIDNVVNHVMERDNIIVDDSINRDTVVLNDIVEKDSSVMNDIIEKETEESSLANSLLIISNAPTSNEPTYVPLSSNGRKPSRFKLERDQKRNQNVKVIALPKDGVSEFEPWKDRKQLLADSISQNEDKDEKEFDRELDRKSVKGLVTNTEPSEELDIPGVESELDCMARDYIRGVYDDDIDLPGPVVDHLDDFEKVNRVVEGHNALLEQEGLVEEYDEDLDMEESDGDDEDGDVLVDIMENDPEEPSQDTQDTIISEEVEQEYHRLRRKLMQSRENGYRKTDSELEFEPIDEEGNPVKVSRFKAARMAFQ